MNFLAICQRLRQEVDVTGTGPTTVVSQTGILGRMVSWAASAYDDIQAKHQNWRWMRVGCTVNTVAADGSYAYGDFTDELTAAVISRFRRWWLEDDEGYPVFKIYLQSAGVGTERWLPYLPWPEFRAIYRIGTVNDAAPAFVSVDPQDKIVLGPKPDAVYVLSGEYQRGNQALAADADTPEMPADYHMLIVYMAMMSYGMFKAAPEVLARGEAQATKLMRQLEVNQRPAMKFGGPLA